MNRWIGSWILVLHMSASASAGTITALSCSPSDVQTAVTSAQAGDIVRIPAGTCSWTSGVSWTAPADVTLVGAGTSATGGGDQTVIVDNIGVDQPIFDIGLAPTGVFRLTGMTFRSGTGAIKDKGSVNFSGPGTIRIDHVHWVATSPSNYRAFNIGMGVFGVLDHSILDLTSTNAIYLSNSRKGTGDTSVNMGNYEWSLPTGFGTSDFFFVEDNIINGDGVSHSTRIWDIFTAGRAVARFNTVTASCIGETHGTGHANDDRGARAQEVYGNTETMGPGQTEPNYTMVEIQSGGGLFWGNTATNGSKNIFVFNVTRKNNDTYSQPAVPTSWGYCGTQFNGTGSAWDQNSDASTGYGCIDMPGRGPGDILSGVFPNKINLRTGTIAWPQQVLEPLYIWANNVAVVSGWGGAVYSDNTGGRMAANRDYYPQATGLQTSATNPFNGTSGTGWGTLANRPTACTTGVGYFATDQGSWNTSQSNPYGVQQNGADGVLYTCTAANTWTLTYTPYTYPHPLQSGVVPPTTTTPPPLTPSPTDAQFLRFKNVFNLNQGSLTISLSRGGTDLDLKIYDRGGNQVRSLNASTASPIWDGRNESGTIVASGMYICVLKQGDKLTKKKLVVVK